MLYISYIRANTQQAFSILLDLKPYVMDKGKSTCAVLLDLSKAFDTVDHKNCYIN